METKNLIVAHNVLHFLSTTVSVLMNVNRLIITKHRNQGLF
jgi:hypothetical protein